MANVLVEESSLQDIADAIRTKNGSQNTYKPWQMAGAIEAIPTGSTPTGTKQISITENGTTTEDVSAYANAEIEVNVSASGSNAPYTGTVTLSERSASVSFDVGTTDTISAVILLPTSESPVKSGGKTVVGYIGMTSGFYKYFGLTTNNSGASMLTPTSSTTAKNFTQSGSTVTVTPTGAGSFEAITYTWYAW